MRFVKHHSVELGVTPLLTCGLLHSKGFCTQCGRILVRDEVFGS